MTREPNTVIVRAVPDPIPVEFPLSRCAYASWPWLTEEFMKELEDG
ncbi:hypothetical protein [Streptomyces sp. NPDC005302]